MCSVSVIEEASRLHNVSLSIFIPVQVVILPMNLIYYDDEYHIREC